MSDLQKAKDNLDFQRRALLRRIPGSIASSEDVHNLIEAVRALDAAIIRDVSLEWDSESRVFLTLLADRISS